MRVTICIMPRNSVRDGLINIMNRRDYALVDLDDNVCIVGDVNDGVDLGRGS